MTFALKSMGPTVLSGAVTTFGSGFCLVFTQLIFFVKFSILIMVTVASSIGARVSCSNPMTLLSISALHDSDTMPLRPCRDCAVVLHADAGIHWTSRHIWRHASILQEAEADRRQPAISELPNFQEMKARPR